MMAEGRLLRGALLISVAVHVVIIGALARRGVAPAIDLDELRVVSVGTYTPPAPRPEISLPRALERHRPAPPRPLHRPTARPLPPGPRPAPPVAPRPRVLAERPPVPPHPVQPRPVVPAPRPMADPRPPAPLPMNPAPAPARPTTAPRRIAQALPRMPIATQPAGNSGGGLHLGSASAAGTVPAGSGGSTSVGHVSNEGAGGSGSGSGEVPRGQGSAEPVRNPVHSEAPGPATPVAPRQPDPPPPPPTVSVRICRKSGLRAGRYCTDVAERSFVSGQEPDQRCDACKPPPPPPDPEHVNRSAESHDAVLVRGGQPDYPDSLRDAGVEGTVEVSYTVDEQGRVTDVKVSRSSGNGELDDCAVRAIKKWRYKPAEQGGEPRAVRMKQPFRFRVSN